MFTQRHNSLSGTHAPPSPLPFPQTHTGCLLPTSLRSLLLSLTCTGLLLLCVRWARLQRATVNWGLPSVLIQTSRSLRPPGGWRLHSTPNPDPSRSHQTGPRPSPLPSLHPHSLYERIWTAFSVISPSLTGAARSSFTLSSLFAHTRSSSSWHAGMCTCAPSKDQRLIMSFHQLHYPPSILLCLCVYEQTRFVCGLGSASILSGRPGLRSHSK